MSSSELAASGSGLAVYSLSDESFSAWGEKFLPDLRLFMPMF